MIHDTCVSYACMHRPPNCPDALHDTMSKCLQQSAENRPEFKDIVADLIHEKSKYSKVEISIEV